MAPAVRKVLVIGLDGLEPTIVDALLAEGRLPNLARLREAGGYSRVGTTTPAQTPVAWSTFATGANPGQHGIFDFVGRNPQTYLPTLALNRYEQPNLFLPPRAVNLRRGETVWQLLGQAGIASTVVRCPCTYPPDDVRGGRLLAGMGVPDLRGGLGTGTFYTTEASVKPQESEQVVTLQADAQGHYATHLIGPRNPKSGADVTLPMKLVPTAGGTLRLECDGDPPALELKPGQWTGWLRVKFKLGFLQSVKGMVRLLLVRPAPQLELYASPVNFDPDAPMFPIAAPPAYARELAGALGLYYTTGMVEDHGGLNNGRFDETAYLAQCQLALDERRRMMRHELNRFHEGLFYILYDTPDRVQHMFWRFREPGHPANAGRPDPGLGDVIADHYRHCDDIVGEALAAVDEQTLCIVLSDHGFNSFQRGVNLNRWLHQEGLLALKPGVEPGEAAGDLLRQVDWEHTQAYALGLSGIYLNLAGREAHGIVNQAEAEAVLARIARGLPALRDQDRAPVRSARRRDEVYSGPYAGESPDLMVNYAPGYRVSWSTALGGVARELVEDNTRRWSGDHIIDPALVPGVLFMNRPFRGDDAHLRDLAPTILAALGVPPGKAMEGKPLLGETT